MTNQAEVMDIQEENELVRKAAEEKDQLALSRLLVKYHPLFMRVTHDRKYSLLGEDVQEIAQLYFLEAVNTFEAGRGVPFAAYLKRRVEWGLDDFMKGAAAAACEVQAESLREKGKEGGSREGESVDIWDALFLKGGECISSGSADMGGLSGRTDSYEQVELKDSVHRAMESLSENERLVLEGIYILDMPAQKVAASLGLSPSRVSHLKESALKKLREQLK